MATPSWTMRLPDKSSGSASPRFSLHSRINAVSSVLMMTLASEPPMNRRRSSRIFSLHCVFKDFLHQEISVIISPRDPIQGRVARAGLDWSIAGLAPAASVKTPSIDLRHRASRLSTVERLRSVMEAAGLVFIPETGCGVGVRLHEPGLRKKTKSLKSQQTTELTGWSLGVVLFRLAAAIRTRERARWPFDSTSPCSSFQSRISPAWSALTMRWPPEPPMKPRRSGCCLDVISKFMSSSKRKSTIVPSGDAAHEIRGATAHST